MKEKIKSSFDAAAQTYDSVSGAQKFSAARLVETLKKSALPGEMRKILDIGSGTGAAAFETTKIYPNADYTLCDISENMIQKAKLRFKRADCIICDAEEYNFTENYDLGISNLALQWFESIDCFLGKILKNCRFFAFSTLLNGSFRDYGDFLFRRGLSAFNYPSIEEMKRICAKQAEIIEWKTESYHLQFENLFGLARYFKKLGVAPRPCEKNILGLWNGREMNLNYDIFFAILKS